MEPDLVSAPLSVRSADVPAFLAVLDILESAGYTQRTLQGMSGLEIAIADHLSRTVAEGGAGLIGRMPVDGELDA